MSYGACALCMVRKVGYVPNLTGVDSEMQREIVFKKMIR